MCSVGAYSRQVAKAVTAKSNTLLFHSLPVSDCKARVCVGANAKLKMVVGLQRYVYWVIARRIPKGMSHHNVRTSA